MNNLRQLFYKITDIGLVPQATAEATSWDWSRLKRYARIGARMTYDLRIGSEGSARGTSTSRFPALQAYETFRKVGMDE